MITAKWLPSGPVFELHVSQEQFTFEQLESETSKSKSNTAGQGVVFVRAYPG
jgi:hypothetical protein